MMLAAVMAEVTNTPLAGAVGAHAREFAKASIGYRTRECRFTSSWRVIALGTCITL